MDRLGVGVKPLLAQLRNLRLPVAQPLEPLAVLTFAVAERAAQLLQDRTRVAFDTDIDVAVAPELQGIDVDGDHLRLLVDSAAETEAEVHRHAGEEGDIAVLERLTAAAVEEELVLLRDAAAPHIVQVDRRVQLLGQLGQRATGVRPVAAAAAHH